MEINPMMFIRRTLYELKRRFGFRVDIYQIISSVPDLQTGKKTIIKKRFTVMKAIVMPSDMIKKFSYDKTYISAGKDFSYGGLYDLDTRGFLIDARDLPAGLDLDTDMYFVYDNKRYDSAKVQRLEHGQGFMLQGTWAKGGLLNQVIEVNAFNIFPLRQIISTVPDVSLSIASSTGFSTQQS